ncbi:MAG: hypothetical protein IT319_18015 [Anaerolineae bacterium]|nr:hypothetical protein [Anaerolineae bacterium]
MAISICKPSRSRPTLVLYAGLRRASAIPVIFSGLAMRTGQPSMSAATSRIPGSSAQPPVRTTPARSSPS